MNRSLSPSLISDLGVSSCGTSAPGNREIIRHKDKYNIYIYIYIYIYIINVIKQTLDQMCLHVDINFEIIILV